MLSRRSDQRSSFGLPHHDDVEDSRILLTSQICVIQDFLQKYSSVRDSFDVRTVRIKEKRFLWFLTQVIVFDKRYVKALILHKILCVLQYEAGTFYASHQDAFFTLGSSVKLKLHFFIDKGAGN